MKLAGRLSDKMSSELGLLLNCVINRAFLFLGGDYYEDHIAKLRKEILLFFILPKYQGKGFGRQVLKMVEDTFPETQI